MLGGMESTQRNIILTVGEYALQTAYLATRTWLESYRMSGSLTFSLFTRPFVSGFGYAVTLQLHSICEPAFVLLSHEVTRHSGKDVAGN